MDASITNSQPRRAGGGSRRWLRASVSLALFLAAGCEQSGNKRPEATSPIAKKPGFIAFVGAGETDPLWPLLRKSASSYAEQLGSIEVRFFSPAANSPGRQLELLQSLKDPEMRGLCIQIIDAAPLRENLDRIARGGIPVISIMRPAPPGISSGHSGVDDAEVGRLLAETTAKALESGSIMLLHAGEEDAVYGPRLNGFRKTISSFPAIEVFAEVNAKGDSRLARQLIGERMERYPRLSAWVALDDWPIRDGGRLDDLLPPQCKFITFGGTPDQWPLLRTGRAPVVVAANYREVGSSAVQFCEGALRDASAFERLYSAPLRAVWASNLDAYIRDWTFWSTGSYAVQTDAMVR